MGSMFGGGGRVPPPPAPPEPPAAPPTASDAEVQAAALKARKLAAKRKGHIQNILTSGSGVDDDAPVVPKVLGEA